VRGRARFSVVAILAAVALSASAVVFAQGCGEVWDPIDASEVPSEIYSGVWAGGQFVAVGNGFTMASPDGLTWDVNSPGTIGWVTGVAYGAGRYVAVVATDRTLYVSKDGHRWRKHRLAEAGWLQAITYGKGLFVVVGQHGKVWTSADGENWTRFETGLRKLLTGVTYGNGRFVAVGLGGVIATSPDGMTWRRRASDKAGKVAPEGMGPGIAYGPAGFVAVDGNSVRTSPDGKSWSRRWLQEGLSLQSVTWTGSEYVAVGWAIVTSSDGVNWTLRDTSPNHMLYGVVSSDTTVLALGSGGAGGGATVLMSSCGP
jgi:hypothetical protein